MFCCIPLSIYEKTYDNNELFEFKIKEQNIYGSKRLGALQTDADIVEINQIFERQQDGTETQKIEYTEKQLKAEGLVIDPDNDAYWYDTHMQFEFKPEDSYKINVNFEIMDKTTNQSLTRLTRLEYINPTQPDTLYSILINLHYNEGIYKPELILTKAAQNGTYKQVHIQTNEGFKEWNFDLTYQIDIKNFEQNQLNVILFNHKSSYYLGKQLYMTTQTGNYVQNITDALNKLGDIAQNQIPVVAYNLAYRINKYEQKFVFKNSTENPVSQSGNITMRYTAIPTPYIEIAADTRIYYNQIGDKQYELSNHLGNVLEVVTDQKLLNVERGIPALTANFNNGYETYPFMPTQHLNKLTVENNMLWAYAINQNYYEQGTYADLHLQPNSTYLLKFEVVKFKIDNELLQVTIKNDNDALLKEIIKESGRYYYKFETNNQTDYQLFFTTYEKGHGSFVLDNIEVIEVADADLDNILQNSQNMAIFVPSVLSFNDYYPFGMLMPGRHANTDRYRYGFNGHENDNEVKGIGNHISFGNYGYDTRLGRRWNIDPVVITGVSGYSTFRNNPNFYKDPDGNSPISIFVKAVAKAGLKKAAKRFVRNQIKRILKRYLKKQGARKWAKQLADDALTFVDHATKTEWWEWVVEAVPIAGDAYGASKLGKQGYTLWKGLEKFEKVAELGDKAAKSAWKMLGKNKKLKGKGADKLNAFIDDVNENIGSKLNDNTIAGAIKELFGLKSGIKGSGKAYNHLQSLSDRMKGLQNKIANLAEDIYKNNVYQGDTRKAAEAVLQDLTKQYGKIQSVMESAKKAVKQMGKIK